MGDKQDTKQSVLVIDDDTRMLQLIQRILEAGGYDVFVAADGVSGLSLFKDKNPNLVLLDIMMPGMDGLAVLDSIRKLSSVPVIMVSAKPESSTIDAASVLGADDYVEKPFHPQVLLARVQARLRRTNWNNQAKAS
jgi:two-component system, OmpR family, response regulator MtrA